ncbi:MAG TPA: type II toxin-antitoxin system RelE/ParE family toxin [Burkholderiaceae bacterium]|jgi:plasmid stabilization system protein ParE|nr:type II toxin-antitoxin system RelE/ParE family toxin [Burkholderiaceae bacterium]
MAAYTVTLLDEAVADLRRLADFAVEREFASETPDWTAPQRGLDAISEGMRLLSWSPYSCRKAELGNGRSRELIVPFGAAGYVVLFEVVGDNVVVGAVRHQREEDYRR